MGEEQELFQGSGDSTGRLCGTSPRCAPSTPAQLRCDLRGFYTGDRARSEPFREQATESSESRRGRVGMK